MLTRNTFLAFIALFSSTATASTTPAHAELGKHITEDSSYCRGLLEDMWEATYECQIAVEENGACWEEDIYTAPERCAAETLRAIDTCGEMNALNERYQYACSKDFSY